MRSFVRAEKHYWSMLRVAVGAVVAAHLMGAGPLRQQLWGGHFYAFLPQGALVASCALLAAALLVAWRRPGWLDRRLQALPGPEGPGALRRIVWIVAGGAVGLAGFWLFRERNSMLGDGNALALNLPLGQSFHPQEPLSLLLHHWFYGLTRGLFEAGARDPADVARGTVGLSSAVAGALFVPVAWALAGELSRLVPAVHRARGARAPAAERPSLVPLLFLLLLAQGYVELFFGYVENYTFHALALGCYLLAALRFLSGRAPLLLPAAALVLALALHLSTVVLAPSFAVLALAALAVPGRRPAAVRDLAFGAALLVGTGLALARLEPGYSLAGALAGVLKVVGTGAAAGAGGYPLLSGIHLSDFLNEQLLIGPVALVLFLTATAVTLARRSPAGWPALFAFATGLGYLAACWIANDSNLGYARNWDLLAPAALVFSTSGLVLALQTAWRPAALRRWLFLLVSLSLFHTAPWVAVNASFARSFTRFESLPLGWGRAEGAVGCWYLAHGDTTRAIHWLDRSLGAYPGNNVAAYSLGRIAVNRGQYARAARSFWTAVRSRPDVGEYRFCLVDAIVRGGGRPEWAKPQLDTLVARCPGEPTYWAAYGVVCLGLGEPDSASAAFARARLLAPQASCLRRLMGRVRQADGYALAVREDWPAWMQD